MAKKKTARKTAKPSMWLTPSETKAARRKGKKLLAGQHVDLPLPPFIVIDDWFFTYAQQTIEDLPALLEAKDYLAIEVELRAALKMLLDDLKAQTGDAIPHIVKYLQLATE